MQEDGRLRFDGIAEGLAWDTPGITVTEGHILALIAVGTRAVADVACCR